jgi:2-oxoglutarate dehydrogenase E1 component
MLIERGDVSADVAKNMDKEFRALLQDRLNMVKQTSIAYQFQKTQKEWLTLRKATQKDFEKSPKTGIKQDLVNKIGDALTTIPKNFKPLKQIDKLLKTRKDQFFGKKELDWAGGELLAYGSLLSDGYYVRLSGQDVQRGTFSHRHAVLKDAETNEAYNSLNHIGANHKFAIYNSLLSEYGVLGFELGYSWAHPKILTIWEAQFGDFANGAQTMIDQFIMTGETKWQRQSGLVMLLPHGQEGQGPEHSSARLERFLNSCAGLNAVVTNITSPANLFHALRRQMTWEFRKPLINMSPKSLLRHPKVVSPVKEFTSGSFQEIIDDSYATAAKCNRVLLCTGKVYYDLLEEQQKSKRKDVAIVRLEQLYPIAQTQLDKILTKYKSAKDVVWVQEEPGNAGAWGYILRNFHKTIPTLGVIAKDNSSSPAVGYLNIHKQKQAELVARAFDVKK